MRAHLSGIDDIRNQQTAMKDEDPEDSIDNVNVQRKFRDFSALFDKKVKFFQIFSEIFRY